MREIAVGKRYKHFKGGIYRVLCVAKDSEDLSLKVVYSDLNNVWVRELSDFLSLVDKEKYPDSNFKYRFEELDD